MLGRVKASKKHASKKSRVTLSSVRMNAHIDAEKISITYVTLHALTVESLCEISRGRRDALARRSPPIKHRFHSTDPSPDLDALSAAYSKTGWPLLLLRQPANLPRAEQVPRASSSS